MCHPCSLQLRLLKTPMLPDDGKHSGLLDLCIITMKEVKHMYNLLVIMMVMVVGDLNEVESVDEAGSELADDGGGGYAGA